MKNSFLIRALLSNQLLIDPFFVLNAYSDLENLFKGVLTYEFDTSPLMAITPSGRITLSGSPIVDFRQVPEGSILSIPLKGVMLKEGALCSYGTEDLGQTLALASTHPNVIGAIIDVNCSGGAVDSIAPLLEGIEQMKAAGKPVVVWADTMASAALYGTANASYIMAQNDISAQIGSIGVMMSIRDPQGDESSRKILSFYAPQSTEKNAPIRQLIEEGKADLIEEGILKPLAERFITDMKRFRNITDDGSVFAGKMYFAKDALSIGLIDGVGNLDAAIAKVEELSKNKKNSKQQKTKPTMKFTNILAALAMATLEFLDDKASLSEDQVGKLKAHYLAKTGRNLELKDLQYAEGHASFTKAQLEEIEQLFANNANEKPENPANSPEMNAVLERLARLEADSKAKDQIIAGFGAKAQDVVAVGAGAGTTVPKIIEMKTIGDRKMIIAGGFLYGENDPLNAVSEKRQWNLAAECIMRGDHRQLASIMAASDIDVSQLESDLGEFVAGRKGEIMEWFRGLTGFENIFPIITGVREGDFFMSVDLTEVSQQYQKAWTPKGDFKFGDRKPKLFDIKFDLDFENLKSIERGWLQEFNREGSDAYKMTFVEYLVSLVIKKATQEFQIAAISGEHKDAVTGLAGHAMNTVDGVRTIIANFEGQKLAKPFYGIGEWNADNILEFTSNMIASIPENMRDLPGLGFYCSTLFQESYWEQRRIKEGTMPTYDPSKSTIPGHDNIRIIAVPGMGNSKRVWITPVGNIRQLMGENDNNSQIVHVEVSKRVVSIFGDYKRAMWPIGVGYPAKTANELANRSYEYQIIWYNNADIPSTNVLSVEKDATSISVKRHKRIGTVDNSAATTIDEITDAVAGDVITIVNGGTTNPSKLANTGSFSLTAAWEPVVVGESITLITRADGKFVEVARFDPSDVNPVEFTADDTTPSVADANAFITNEANTAATAITALDNGTVGETYTIYGGGGTHASTIANSGNFVLTEAWTAAEGSFIKLYFASATRIVEVDRG